MDWLIILIVNAVVFLLAAKVMSSVDLKGVGTAIWVAILFGIIGFLTNWLLSRVVNIATLGVFYFTGLHFITQIIVNAIVIEIVDKISSGFKTRGFMANIILAILIALAGALVTYFTGAGA